VHQNGADVCDICVREHLSSLASLTSLVLHSAWGSSHFDPGCLLPQLPGVLSHSISLWASALRHQMLN
jgi:hypothetical protein